MKKTIQVKSKETIYSLLSNIPYGHTPYWYNATVRPMCLDLILPKNRANTPLRPLIIFICGGGFLQQDHNLWMPTLMPYVLQGYAVASVDYRVACQAPYPAAVQDIKQAIRFLRAHSEEFRLDTERFAVMGESAGGYLAAMMAVQDEAFETGDWLDQSSRVQAVVDFYGKVDLSAKGSDGSVNGAIAFFADSDDPKELLKASPVAQIGPDAPPFLILHGERDELVSIGESERLYEVLTENHIETEFYTLKERGHGADAFFQSEIRELIIDFLNRVMKVNKD